MNLNVHIEYKNEAGIAPSREKVAKFKGGGQVPRILRSRTISQALDHNF
jgi:hypothetical protein